MGWADKAGEFVGGLVKGLVGIRDRFRGDAPTRSYGPPPKRREIDHPEGVREEIDRAMERENR